MEKPDVALFGEEANKYQSFAEARPDYQAYLRIFDSTFIEVSRQMGDYRPDVVEFCAGPGHITKRLSDHVPLGRATLIDVNPTFLDLARGLRINASSIDYVVGDVIEAPLEREYDMVVSSFAYHHMPPDKKLDYVRKAERVLRSTGFIFLAEIFLPNKKAEEQFYGLVAQRTPETQKTPEYLGFLQDLVASTRCEFKVSKRTAEHHFMKYGFEKAQEKKIWPTDNAMPADQGMFVQIYQKPEESPPFL